MNHLAISGILIFISSLISAILVYLKAPKGHTRVAWSLFSLSVALWGLGLFRAFSTDYKNIALFWGRFLNLSAIFTPVFFFHFVLSFANKLKVKRKELLYYYLAILVYFLLVLISPHSFVADVIPKFSFKYYPIPGFLYYLFPLIFAYLTIYGTVILFKELKNSLSYRRNQIKYLLLGVIPGFAGGSTTFFLVFGLKIYPFGTYLVPMYVLTVAYAIVRYRLMDISVIIKRTFIFGILFGGVVAVMYLPMFLWQEFLRHTFSGVWWIIIGLIFLVILITAFPLYRLLVKVTDRWLFQKKYDYQKTLKEASKGMIDITDPDRLLSVIARFLNKKIRVQHTFILVWDDIVKHYAIKGFYGETKIKDIKLGKDSSLIKWFITTKDVLVKRKLLKKKEVSVLVKEELDHWLENEALFRSYKDLQYELNNIKLDLETLGASVVIPSFYKSGLLGLFILGDKLSGDMYTQEDLDILSTLANDAAVAIKNAQLFSDLSQEKEKMITVFNNMSDGAILTDIKLRIMMFNEASCNLLNLTPVDFSNRNFTEVIGNFNISPSLEEFQKSEKRSFICEMSRGKGQSFFISNKVNKIVDDKGNTLGYIMILRDVTVERTEEALKKNFLALVSHKLRTPLTPIIGYTELLLMQKELNDSQKEIVQNISERSQILSGLINELISFTTLESETIELKRSSVDLNMLIQSVLSNLKPLIEKNKAQIFIDNSLMKLSRIYVDGDRIKESVVNLLENAVKFNNKETKEVKIEAISIDNKFIRIKIQDNGPGIPGEEFDKIFQRFYQVEEGFSGQIEGAGLGLALVKRVVELHGGSVWVESKLGEGSTFYFTLPVYQEQ